MNPFAGQLFSSLGYTLQSKEEVVSFLKEKEEYSLFLLSNLERYGVQETDAPYSGNFKLLRKNGKIIAAFCLTKKGVLLLAALQQDQEVAEAMIAACLEEKRLISGVLGEWSFASFIWDLLKQRQIIKKETWVEREVLYAVDVGDTSYVSESGVSLLKSQDADNWIALREAYVQEMGFPSNSREDVHKEFLNKVLHQEVWGLFHEGKLVAIADLNAHFSDLAQLGGVYTLPEFRNRGFSSRLMRHLICDLKKIHKTRKLIIFTGHKNLAARKVYERLNLLPYGYYALLFGSG